AASGGKARLSIEETGMVYHPVPPHMLYVAEDEWAEVLRRRNVTAFRAYAAADLSGTEDAGGRPGRDFADVRARPNENVFEAFIAHTRAEQNAGRRVVLAAYTAGSKARLAGVLRD